MKRLKLFIATSYKPQARLPRQASRIWLIVLLMACSLKLAAQEDVNPTELNGYIKYMNTLIVPPTDTLSNTSDNFFHNRLNFKWYLNDNWTFKTSMRNRFFWGELVEQQPELYRSLENDPGFMDLSFIWATGSRSMGHTIFDRLNFAYQDEKWEVIIGRERINWGMTLIWNPNDIFNTYSFFDFDYEERPGTDAVTVNYFTSATAQFGLTYAPGKRFNESTIAARYRWNTGVYDLQAFTGYQREFFVIGAGWAGDIKGAGFRGEGTYFIPEGNSTGESQFVGTLDADYSFPNKIALYLQMSYLFNSLGINASTGDYAAWFLDRNLSVQTLSPAMHNVFFNVRGQITPVVNLTLSSMVNPADGSWFVGPALDISVFQNFDVLLNAQLFRGDPMTLFGDGGSLVFGRLKYSF